MLQLATIKLHSKLPHFCLPRRRHNRAVNVLRELCFHTAIDHGDVALTSLVFLCHTYAAFPVAILAASTSRISVFEFRLVVLVACFL